MLPNENTVHCYLSSGDKLFYKIALQKTKLFLRVSVFGFGTKRLCSNALIVFVDSARHDELFRRTCLLINLYFGIFNYLVWFQPSKSDTEFLPIYLWFRRSENPEEGKSSRWTEIFINRFGWVRLSPKGNTGSRLFTEVKPCWTGLIFRWVTI